MDSGAAPEGGEAAAPAGGEEAGKEKAETGEETQAADGEKKSESGEEEEKEPEKSTIFYVTDEVQQAQYIAMFRKNDKDAVILKENIDQPFITQLEQRNENLRFARIDSELADEFKSRQAGCPCGEYEGSGCRGDRHGVRGEPPDAGHDENVRDERHVRR